MKSRVQRISDELTKELQEIANKNNMKVIEASKEVAKLIRRNKNKKFIREIKF